MAASARNPEELDRLLEEAFAAGDVEALVALYEPDALFANAGRTLMRGHAELRNGLSALAAARPTIRGNPRVVAQFGEIAVMYNDWIQTGTDETGKYFERAGKAVEVVRKQPDGSWRFLFDDPFAR